MRINSGSAGSAGDTKTYDAESLIAAANARAKHYQTLRSQFHTLRAAFNQIANLGVDFQGKGADAIKKFYAAQVNVVDAWLRMIDKQIAYYHGVAGTIDDKNLGGDTQVQVPFLDEDLSRGYARSKEMVREQRDDIAKILSDISDLVPINVFSNHDVDQALDAAEQKRAKMVLDVQDLDQNLTNEYRQVTDDLPYIASLYGELINATGQGADVQPMHFNAQAYHDSKIYQVQDEMAKETQNYLKSKKQQEKARQVSKKDTQPLNPLLENAAKGIILKKEIQDGVQEGAKDTIKDTIIGLWDAVTSPRQTLEGTWFAATHLRETFDTVKHALIQSYEKDMVHGNAYTRSRWVTYALGTIALSFVGTKGIDKVGKMAKLGRIGEAASKARALTKTTLVKHTHSIKNKISEWNTTFYPKMQFADGNVPFNVIDSKGLKNKLLNIPDSEPTFVSRINNVRNLIQQASVKRADNVSKDGVGKTNFTRGFDVVPKYSTYEQRLKTTPVKMGQWNNERAESLFISDKTGEIKKYLDEAGVDGVEYKNGMPDFAPFSTAEVKLNNMTDDRKLNFSTADELLAEKWSTPNKKWTAEDIADWREDNKYTWHELNDLETIQLVPSKINSVFKHFGGVGEYKIKVKLGE